MKFFLIVFFSIGISCISHSQLISGDLVDEKRSLLSTSDFKLEDPNTGLIFFKIAVNRKGEITSAKVDTEGTTVISTPSRIKATAMVKKLKFQEGTYFPEFHHARLKITLVEPKATLD